MSHRIRLRAALAGAVLCCAVPVLGAEQCYDFSGLAVGTTYRLGDEIDISIGKVRIREFFIDGNRFQPANPDIQYLKVNQSQIAQSAPPEMHASLVSMQLIPKQPVREITMKVAQQLGVTGRLPALLEVNGARRDFRGSFSQADGRTLGTPAQGEARFRVEMTPDSAATGQPNSFWERGRLRVRAEPGASIAAFTIGAQAANYDEVCFRW